MSDVPAPDYIEYMDIAEFQALGLVQEINRLILHPLGLALEVRVSCEDGTVTKTLSGVWDFRHDPEGVLFEDGQLSPEAAERIATAIEERGPARFAALGYVVQPLPEDVKQLNLTVKEPFNEEQHATPYVRFAGGPPIEAFDDES